MNIIDINDASGAIVAPEKLRDAERVHRQLRPQVPADYEAAMKHVFAGGGRMCVAERDGRIMGVAVYRMYVNTFAGLHVRRRSRHRREHAFIRRGSRVDESHASDRALGYNNGVAIFTFTKGGLMADASVGGQKFTFEKL